MRATKSVRVIWVAECFNRGRWIHVWRRHVRLNLANVLEHRTIVHNEQLFATQSERNTSTVELLDKVSSLLIEQGLSAAEQLPLAMHYLGKVITVQATGLAFKDGFLLLALCFLVAAVSALALTRAPSFQARPS